MNREFWNGRKVLLTGHSGFKGSWLCMMLKRLGAEVYGVSNGIPTNPSLFELAKVDDIVHSRWSDINDPWLLFDMKHIKPSIVIHFAAQAIVKEGYNSPKKTFMDNTMGTLSLLENCREIDEIERILIITTDKVYGDDGGLYKEVDPMKSADPYSTSKACAELVTSCYKKSFLKDKIVATARAGNVVGFGDFAYRVIPMTMDALMKGEKPPIWDPGAKRPWQSVLDCLDGYLTIIESGEEGAWNVGPDYKYQQEVGEVVDKICEYWNGDKRAAVECPDTYRLNVELTLDTTKINYRLGWKPKWDLETTLANLVVNYKAYQAGYDVRELCEGILEYYEKT